MIELYLENQNFWDMRRWLLAEEYFGVKAKGMNIKASTIDDFAKLTEISFERKFKSPTQYLLPIPSTDINREHLMMNVWNGYVICLTKLPMICRLFVLRLPSSDLPLVSLLNH